MNPIFIGTIGVDLRAEEKSVRLCSWYSWNIILITQLFSDINLYENLFILISFDAKITTVPFSLPLLTS